MGGNSTTVQGVNAESLRVKIFHFLSTELKRSTNPPMVSDEPKKRIPFGFRL
jgi:hypothetical protein